MNRNLTVNSVDETVSRRMRFLAIGMHKTMAQLLKIMVDDYWQRHSNNIVLDKKANRLFKRITKRKPIPI